MKDIQSLLRRGRRFAACVVFAFTGTATVAEPVTFTSGELLGYWPLDGDFRDATGRHDGEFVSVDGAPAKFVDGSSGLALDLRENESHVELNLAVGAGPKSISLFALTPSFEPELVWVGNRAPGSMGDFDHRFYLGTFTGRLFWGAGRDHRRGKAWPDLSPDRFHHYALVQRADGAGGGTLEIYQSGELLETTTYTGTTVSDPLRLMRIGRGGGQRTHPALSIVDDVAIFNRAISAAEVAAISREGNLGSLLAPWQNEFEPAIRRLEARDMKQPPPKGAVLFIGSSSFTRWRDMTDYFPGIEVINRGFGGAEFSDVLHFFDRVVAPYEPRVVAIYAGSHDLRKPGGGPPEVVRMFKVFCDAVHVKFPATKVSYLSMKPSLAKWNSIHLDREANRLVAEFAAATPLVEFIDIWTPMVAEGEPPPAKYFASDRNHPSAEAYKLWASVIRPYIE